MNCWFSAEHELVQAVILPPNALSPRRTFIEVVNGAATVPLPVRV
jgi:hypothetical protein